MGIKATKFSLSLPFGIGKLDLEPNEVEQRSAWTLYVELMTRVAIQPLDKDSGLLRDALNSLYTLFKLTRNVLCTAGPEVANGPQSLGPVAIEVLNKGLRPFMAKWHPRLLVYEAACPEDVNLVDHERHWEDYGEMRQELEDLQNRMREYADMLAKIAGAK